jgi:hypothetical protein
MPTTKETQQPPVSVVDVDPEDPSQLLDEAGQFSIVELDAQPQAEADAELDAAVATTADDYTDIIDATDIGDAGDLYGVHVPRAADPESDVKPNRDAFDGEEDGEHVFESLEKKMAENGTANPEEDVELEDESDPQGGHRKTDTRDRPIADKGSGGAGGL